MGYVESNLMQGEQVRYRARLHWIIFCTLSAFLTAFIAPLIVRWTSEFAVTNRRVVIKVGLISRHTIELNLQKIEGIGVDQGILGRILGYGTIIVSGTGGTKEPFHRIADPLAFRKAVNDAQQTA
jgi:uncharacterized membrane protein YdbT with pleckstrin-like domain